MNKMMLSRVSYPLLGVLALSLPLSGAGLTYAIYDKAFTDTAEVTVLVERVEDQLAVPADVKVRGVRVGEVRSLRATDDGKVALEVALDPSALPQIPSDVTARVLPKTLFGEKFVDLVPGPGDAGASLRPGAVVRQDLSQRSVELQQVFDDLGPLLRAVRPADLNAALSGLATALGGRGEQLGQTIDLLGGYTSELREVLPDLQADLTLLADVTDRYGEAAPALLDIARSTSTTAQTLAEREQVLEAVLRDTYGVSSRTAALLAENEERIVDLSATLRPTLELLAEFAPEYDCVFNGAKVAIKRIYDVFGGDDGPFKIKGRLRVGQSRGVYPRELAPDGELAKKLVDDLRDFGPSCPVINPDPVGGTPNDDIPEPAKMLIGTYRGPLGLPGGTPLDTGRQQEEELGEDPGPPLPIPQLPRIPVLGDPTGSLAEREAVERAAAAALGRLDAPVNPVVDLLLGPMLRGTIVEEAP